MFSLPDLTLHVAFAIAFLGRWLLGNGKRVGWLFSVASELVGITVGVWTGMTALIVWGVVFLIAEVRGYRKWEPVDDIANSGYYSEETS